MPNVFTDNSDTKDLTKDELLDVVATLRQENKTLLKARNKVGLTFKRIPEDGNDSIVRLEDGQFPFLTKINSLSVTKDTSTDGNIALIEGENLAVLAALQMTHKGKVDVIYIDPPYNTGNDDFIYEDKRMYNSDASDLENLENTLDGKTRTVGKDDPYRHSKWLSFMERRLFLSKELLSETGVIFVSIDDNEQARLKLLMDEIFGSENFEASLKWRRRANQPNDKNKMIAGVTEYIHVFYKNRSQQKHGVTFKGIPMGDKQKANYSNPDNDPRGNWMSKPWAAARGQGGSKYEIKLPSGESIDTIWLGKKETYENLRLDDRIYFATPSSKPRKKVFIEERVEFGQAATDWWDVSFGTNSQASEHLRALLGEMAFDYPKPVNLIKTILTLLVKKNAVILDFFAGSGTTGHAVAELNKEDGGNRSAILVTNNEGGIARNVTRERLARVLTGENWADGKAHEPLPGNLSFYTIGFKTLSSNPLTTAQMMESKFDGLLSLENNALNVVEHDPDEDYVIYRNSGKLIFIWKNLFSLYDGDCEELLESLKNTMDADEYIAYIPSESEIPGITSDGWKVVSFPHEYITRYEAMIATMRRNQTLPNSNK